LSLASFQVNFRLIVNFEDGLVYGLRQAVRNQCLSGLGPGRVKV
jgi:hypothetical protein